LTENNSKKGKIGHGYERGAWHQDRLADWPSVVIWLDLTWKSNLYKYRCSISSKYVVYVYNTEKRSELRSKLHMDGRSDAEGQVNNTIYSWRPGSVHGIASLKLQDFIFHSMWK
jgi:hypothetical protein